MKLVFVGADHEVTGSCHYLEVAGKHILVDYGMEQGINVFENVPLPVAESMIDKIRQIISVCGLRQTETVRVTNANDSVYGSANA